MASGDHVVSREELEATQAALAALQRIFDDFQVSSRETEEELEEQLARVGWLREAHRARCVLSSGRVTWCLSTTIPTLPFLHHLNSQDSGVSLNIHGCRTESTPHALLRSSCDSLDARDN